MIDKEGIGRRIFEVRKILRKISQEKMVEDLGWYQPDLSVIEKNGTDDLFKLDMMADYLNVPLEYLIFGRSYDTVEKYAREKMTFKKIKSVKHKNILAVLMGVNSEDLSKKEIIGYECGLYTIYMPIEFQYQIGN